MEFSIAGLFIKGNPTDMSVVLKSFSYDQKKYPPLGNVTKLVRKDIRQRARGLKKEQKELREGKIDSKPRRSGLRLKKECEEGFSVRRRSRRKCGCP